MKERGQWKGGWEGATSSDLKAAQLAAIWRVGEEDILKVTVPHADRAVVGSPFQISEVAGLNAETHNRHPGSTLVDLYVVFTVFALDHCEIVEIVTEVVGAVAIFR
jgi:hypothetical protein